MVEVYYRRMRKVKKGKTNFLTIFFLILKKNILN